MKKIILLITFTLSIGTAFAQDVAGTWYGTLQVAGTQLHLVFHISKTQGLYSATMDSPDQGASGLKVDKTSFTDKTLILESVQFGFKYSGVFLPDSNKIAGTFSQGPGSFPLTLTTTQTLTTIVKPAIRPQDPTTFPYIQEEVVFMNKIAGNKLAGTLTLPKNGTASKIVILISGSGPQDRNEEIKQFNHRPFLVWSDWLTRQGIAVLRYDDRGIGQSTGSFYTATTADFADDAEAAVNFIQSRADLKNLKIGLMGHSEGGMIAPIVASRNKNVSFMVLLAGPGIPIAQLMVRQNADELRLAHASPEEIRKSEVTNAAIYAGVRQYQNLPATKYKVKIDSLLRSALANSPEAGKTGENLDALVNQNEKVLTLPWFRYFINFDPSVYLIKVKCPVLALNGSLDMQVSAEENLNGIRKALQKAGNNHFQAESLTGLNHLFQPAKTGGVSEYAEIGITVDTSALQRVSEWINKR